MKEIINSYLEITELRKLSSDETAPRNVIGFTESLNITNGYSSTIDEINSWSEVYFNLYDSLPAKYGLVACSHRIFDRYTKFEWEGKLLESYSEEDREYMLKNEFDIYERLLRKKLMLPRNKWAEMSDYQFLVNELGAALSSDVRALITMVFSDRVQGTFQVYIPDLDLVISPHGYEGIMVVAKRESKGYEKALSILSDCFGEYDEIVVTMNN